MNIADKVALVTGGAGGFGEATARRVVADGGRVVIADLAREPGELLAKELGKAAIYVSTDVTDEDSVSAAVAAAGELGELRVMVSAHGGPTALAKIVDRQGKAMPQAAFDRTVALYLSGVFNVMRQAAAAMAALPEVGSSGRGVIVNTASIAAYEAQVGQADYAAAKGGVVGLNLAAARDLASHGIRVMTIAPGTFFTPAYGMDEDQAQEAFGTKVPFPSRMGRAQEYADLVASIVANDYLNGEVIRIDGALRFPPRG
ncbi:SDR family NAD(P)-dependent oxidoreductase [Arthrobacter sp. W4I7]|uniref:SDR family NAD(P)-dependent oxidoreductase n=1 Tax=Arthrobacter sp. W4I7 TaxID=3042296 RepID=UPI00277E4D19|nr:SDR family NAD(P)-dependent oxidoreductase [Arthrobacter sp. W4I7]MDQ0691397.1 NAD(P)-dependent dehydrogenase (short-subunit alcohol dehydrogenase family) [Arthrobacter sp. W4I7]